MPCRLRITLSEVINITILALKYFLRHGLEQVKDLPEKTVTALLIGLALNFQDRASFIQAMKPTGIDATRLGALWDSETHLSKEMAGLESAKVSGLNTKIWTSNGSCCKDMDGQETSIGKPFSNGQMIAHSREGCQCSTTFKKGMNVPADGVFTRGQIAEMSPQEYSQNRDKIIEQYAS